jgi:hypothetical protein
MAALQSVTDAREPGTENQFRTMESNFAEHWREKSRQKPPYAANRRESPRLQNK